MHILFLFLGGIGLGSNDPESNPFTVAHMPTLTALTNGRRWLRDTGYQQTQRAVFIPTDPMLGVPGRPQSGSSQAAILTGLNVPRLIGRHYGPKPDAQTRDLLAQDNFFKQVTAHGGRAALLDAYPPALLQRIERKKTLPSSIQQAARESGQRLFSLDDLRAGRALTAEWTGIPLREYLKDDTIPSLSAYDAGKRLVEISREYDFALHSHWMTDYIGHRGTLPQGVQMLETFDQVMAGVLDTWQDDEGLVIVTSDHGNMENIGDRRHTENLVPTLIIGGEKSRFAAGFKQLTDFVPHMARILFPIKR